MVESIGARLATGAPRVLRTAVDTPTAAVSTTAAKIPATTGTFATLAADMAASAPVDTDRVAQIKQAIKDGRYPIMPARIADSLIASRLEWKSNNEPA